MALAKQISSWSKDTSRGVGCVIIGDHREVLSTGYNGFPRGVNDEILTRHQRPEKYKWTEHAERNAIYNAARIGMGLDDSRMYSTCFPCSDCARAIVQSGIRFLVTYAPNFQDPTYGEDFVFANQLLTEGNVSVKYLQETNASTKQ